MSSEGWEEFLKVLRRALLLIVRWIEEYLSIQREQ